MTNMIFYSCEVIEDKPAHSDTFVLFLKGLSDTASEGPFTPAIDWE